MATASKRKKPCLYCGKRLMASSKGRWRKNLARHIPNCQPANLEWMRFTLGVTRDLLNRFYPELQPTPDPQWMGVSNGENFIVPAGATIGVNILDTSDKVKILGNRFETELPVKKDIAELERLYRLSAGTEKKKDL